MTPINLLSNEAATGSSAFITRPGIYCFEVVGTFAGNMVSLERQGPDGATWYAVGIEAELKAAGAANVEIPAGNYRAAVSAAGSSGLYAKITALRLY